MTRIDRSQLPEATRILAVYLENAALGLGVDLAQDVAKGKCRLSLCARRT